MANVAEALQWRVVLGAHTREPIAVLGAGRTRVDYRVLGPARWLYIAWLERLGSFWVGGHDGGKYADALRDLEHDYR